MLLNTFKHNQEKNGKQLGTLSLDTKSLTVGCLFGPPEILRNINEYSTQYDHVYKTLKPLKTLSENSIIGPNQMLYHHFQPLDEGIPHFQTQQGHFHSSLASSAPLVQRIPRRCPRPRNSVRTDGVIFTIYRWEHTVRKLKHTVRNPRFKPTMTGDVFFAPKNHPERNTDPLPCIMYRDVRVRSFASKSTIYQLTKLS